MNWETMLDERTAKQLPGLKILSREPMSRHTSFHTGGPAKRMAFPENREELTELYQIALECGANPIVIGNGTNLLCPDNGLDRLVIATENMCRIEANAAEGCLTLDAGVSLRRAAESACQNSLAGLEFAHGIPGTVGGAVCMNAGAYGGEMSQVLVSADVFFPVEGIRTLSVEELKLGYRHSLFTDRPEAMLLSAVLRLKPGEMSEIRAEMRELMERRKNSQPLNLPSAGSTFKRPAGYFAGTLIDQCGLKGLRIGGAQVSEKHAGFVVNCGGASSADITALIQEVQRRVREQTGVTLEPEVRILQ